jgi:hypothetical protein
VLWNRELRRLEEMGREARRLHREGISDIGSRIDAGGRVSRRAAKRVSAKANRKLEQMVGHLSEVISDATHPVTATLEVGADRVESWRTTSWILPGE